MNGDVKSTQEAVIDVGAPDHPTNARPLRPVPQAQCNKALRPLPRRRLLQPRVPGGALEKRAQADLRRITTTGPAAAADAGARVDGEEEDLEEYALRAGKLYVAILRDYPESAWAQQARSFR